MTIHILRIIIVCALLEAPFVCGSRGNEEVEFIPDQSRPNRPSSLNGGGIKGIANGNTLRSSPNPEKQLPNSVAAAHLRGARSTMGRVAEDDRQLRADNIFRSVVECDTFCTKPRRACGNRCRARITGCEAQGVECHPWLCRAFCRGDRSTRYCQNRQIPSDECNRYREGCSCRNYGGGGSTETYDPVSGLTAFFDYSTNEVVVRWDKVNGPKLYDVRISKDNTRVKRLIARGSTKKIEAALFDLDATYDVAVRRKRGKIMGSSPYVSILYKHVVDESQMHKANDETKATTEDYVGDLKGNVLDNDVDPDFGHTLTVDLHQVAKPPGSRVTFSGDGLSMMIELSNGSTLSLSTNGDFTFHRAPGAYQELSGTQDEYEEFKYVVGDNHGNSAEATLYIRIDGANDAPIALSDLFIHSSNDPTTIQDVADGCVLENDKDIDIGDVANLAVCVVDGIEIHNDIHQHVDLGQQTKLSIGADGCFTMSGLATEYQYLPKGETTDVCFFYQACDGHQDISSSYKSNVAEACVRIEGVYEGQDYCYSNNGECDPLTECINGPGGATCGPCPPEYSGTGESGCVPNDFGDLAASDPHEINGDDAFDEDGNFLANFFQGDMLITLSQAADMFGIDFANDLQNSGFVFLPEPEERSRMSRAISITHESTNRWPEVNRFRGFSPEVEFLVYNMFGFEARSFDDKVIVPYEFSSDITSAEQKGIKKAMKELEKSEVLRFVSASEYAVLTVEGISTVSPTIIKHAIRFVRRDYIPNTSPPKPFCGSSNIGFYKDPNCRCKDFFPLGFGCTCQTITLSFARQNECGYHAGVVQHEILHALGFHHEHSRSDRKNFIEVDLDNVIEEKRHNFRVEQESVSLGTTYDYGSIMHYPRNAFLTDEADASNLKSIEVITDKATEPFKTKPHLVGRTRIGLSNTDLLQLRLLYLCSSGAKNNDEFTKCTDECPCWENAPYECTSNGECQVGLSCVSRPYDLKGREEPYCTILPANTKGCEILEPNQPRNICVKSHIYENNFETINPALPNQIPQCGGSALFDVQALYTPTGIPTGLKFEEKPGTTFEAVILDTFRVKGLGILGEIVSGVSHHLLFGRYALGGFSIDHVGPDGKQKEDMLALKLPSDLPYFHRIKVTVDLAAANLPPSECGGPFPYEGGTSYQAELHVGLLADDPINWDGLFLMSECVITGNTIDGSSLIDPDNYGIDWKHNSCTLFNDLFVGSGGGSILLFHFEGSAPYQIFDNLVVTGS